MLIIQGINFGQCAHFIEQIQIIPNFIHCVVAKLSQLLLYFFK